MSTNYQPLYEALGCLFYSIASSDEEVSKAEIRRTTEAIKQKWIPLEDSKDEYGMDAAHNISTSFDSMLESTASAADAWNKFSDTYKQYSELFTPKIKELAIETAEDIANAFMGTNKNESLELDELKKLFKS